MQQTSTSSWAEFTTELPTQSTQPHYPALMTIKQFHQALGGTIGINALRNLVKEGRIKHIRYGENRRLIPASELSNWLLREMDA